MTGQATVRETWRKNGDAWDQIYTVAGEEIGRHTWAYFPFSENPMAFGFDRMERDVACSTGEVSGLLGRAKP